MSAKQLACLMLRSEFTLALRFFSHEFISYNGSVTYHVHDISLLIHLFIGFIDLLVAFSQIILLENFNISSWHVVCMWSFKSELNFGCLLWRTNLLQQLDNTPLIFHHSVSNTCWEQREWTDLLQGLRNVSVTLTVVSLRHIRWVHVDFKV